MGKYIRWIVIVITIMVVLILAFWARSLNAPVRSTAVLKELRKLNRLETAAFTIEKIIDTKKESGGKLQEFLFGDRLLLVAQGEVIAGVDLSMLQQSDISIRDESLTVRLPAPQIFVVSIDNQKTSVYDRQTGIFSKGNTDLETEARQEAEVLIRQAACEADILNEAAENARNQLRTLFQALGFKTVTIIIPSADCI